MLLTFLLELVLEPGGCGPDLEARISIGLATFILRNASGPSGAGERLKVLREYLKNISHVLDGSK